MGVVLNRWRSSMKLLCVVVVMAPVLTGCWDRLELEERAVILGIAVDEAVTQSDKTEDKVTHLKHGIHKPQKKKIQVTVQVAVPGRIPLGGSSDTSSGGKGRSKPIWVLTAQGYTIDDALMVMQQELADQMFFGHLRVIVISEKIARKGVQNLNDYFRRSPEVRRLAWMVVSQGKAAELMKASPQLARVPPLYLIAMMDNAVKMGKLPNDFLGIFWSADSSRGKEPYLPYVDLKKTGQVGISGLAYFKGDKMVGTTKPLQIGLYMAATGTKAGGYNSFEILPNSSDTFMFKATNRTTITKVSMKNGRPLIQLRLQVEGNIEEKSTEITKVNKHKTILQLQDELSKSSEGAIKDLIKKMQKDGSDIFGFGEYIRAKQPEYWNREIKNKTNWQEQFKDLSVEVNMKIKIRRVGMKAT
jgi:spore germination protein KC